MRGFIIATSDGQRIEVEATRYEVDEEGTAVFFVDEHEQAAVPAEKWERIDNCGIPLSHDWPPAGLDDLLATLSSTLGAKYGHYVHLVADGSRYASGYFNDLDALTAAILTAVNVDYSSRDPEVDFVRGTIAAVFRADPPSGPVVPSDFMTDIHCPRCGDTLCEVMNRRAALECHSGKMDFSEVASQWLRDCSTSDPSNHDDRSTTVNWGSSWFCPADGFRMSATDNELPLCPSCKRILPGRLIYNLIEFHGPHA